MRPWQFSKPRGPGFGISSSFYLTVLSSKPVLPPILAIVSPSTDLGAVEGFGVPLGKTADRSSLGQPMERGAYALATKDRKTVVRMLVLSKEEACFDPETFARSALAVQSDPELVVRVRATWTVLQLTFETHDPAVYPAAHFFLSVARRLAELAEGVVADPVSRRYLLPDQVLHTSPGETLDARDVVAVTMRERPDGLHFFTLGLQKFALPELEIYGVEDHLNAVATKFLLGAAQAVLQGSLMQVGGKLGGSAIPFEIRTGGLDRALWEGIECFELLPPTQHTATEGLLAWAEEAAEKA